MAPKPKPHARSTGAEPIVRHSALTFYAAHAQHCAGLKALCSPFHTQNTCHTQILCCVCIYLSSARTLKYRAAVCVPGFPTALAVHRTRHARIGSTLEHTHRAQHSPPPSLTSARSGREENQSGVTHRIRRTRRALSPPPPPRKPKQFVCRDRIDRDFRSSVGVAVVECACVCYLCYTDTHTHPQQDSIALFASLSVSLRLPAIVIGCVLLRALCTTPAQLLCRNLCVRLRFTPFLSASVIVCVCACVIFRKYILHTSTNIPEHL